MDPKQIHRVLFVYRAAKTARSVRRGYSKAKRMLDDRNEQTDVLLDAAEFAERIREDRVEPEDVRNCVRFAVNSTPSVYRFVVRHIKKQKGIANAEA